MDFELDLILYFFIENLTESKYCASGVNLISVPVFRFPTVPISEIEASSDDTSYTGIVLAIIGAIIVGIIVYIRRKRKRKT